LPPLEEQIKITEHLDKQCSAIDKLIAALTSGIALMTEYRTRLISDVVTGKVDVRVVAVGACGSR
jgi:type I restriction enzyme S subunit